MSTIYFISLCMSFILSYYDIKYQEYPIFLWILFTISTIILTPITKVSIVLCLFGILAEVVDINIGSGDFLYLATIGLSLPLHQMLFYYSNRCLVRNYLLFSYEKNEKNDSFSTVFKYRLYNRHQLLSFILITLNYQESDKVVGTGRILDF